MLWLMSRRKASSSSAAKRLAASSSAPTHPNVFKAAIFTFRLWSECTKAAISGSGASANEFRDELRARALVPLTDGLWPVAPDIR